MKYSLPIRIPFLNTTNLSTSSYVGFFSPPMRLLFGSLLANWDRDLNSESLFGGGSNYGGEVFKGPSYLLLERSKG